MRRAPAPLTGSGHYPFLLPADYSARTFGMDDSSRSGKPGEIYCNAGFDPAGLRQRILNART
jgi:hypothetical protein